MKKAEGEALQRQVATLQDEVRNLKCSLTWQLQHNARLREWNQAARRLLGLWMKSVYHHPSRPPVGSTRSHLKEW